MAAAKTPSTARPARAAKAARTVHPRPVRTISTTDHVDGIVTSLGPKLRRLRQEQRLSLQQLAAKADVSAAAIHKIERSDMVPTITTLLKIAAALERPVGCFIDEEEDEHEPTSFITAAERPAVYTSHRGMHLDGISGSYANFIGAAAIATVEPGATSGEKLLDHPGEELVLVTEGSLVFEVEGRRYVLAEGDAIHFLGNQAHHWANETKTPAKAVWFATRDR